MKGLYSFHSDIEPRMDKAAVIQELQTLCDAFTALFRCKDIDGMVAYYTKDCKIITPHENFVNESGTLACLKYFIASGAVDSHLTIDDVEMIDQNYAYITNRRTITFKDGSKKDGKSFILLKKVDDHWCIHVECLYM
ncbi:hypothetical protein EMCRGX_G023093 [Ephydatia muelleri]